MTSNDPFKDFDHLSIDYTAKFKEAMQGVEQARASSFQPLQQKSQELIAKNAMYAKSLREASLEKSRTEQRRHEEIVDVLREQVQKLEALLKSSENAIEQRDALIRFVVQIMVGMETSKEEKKKTLGEVMIRFASLAAIGADLSDVYKLIEDTIEELAKEE